MAWKWKLKLTTFPICVQTTMGVPAMVCIPEKRSENWSYPWL